MDSSQVQQAIDKAGNLNNIKTAIEVIRELEEYKNTEPKWVDSESAIPTYFMYKDLHAVERILLNKYTEDLRWIYWLMHKYISNTIQKALFEEIVDLRVLNNVMKTVNVMYVEFSINRSYDEIDYIDKGDRILHEFGTMVNWISSRNYDPIYEREAYYSGFLTDEKK